MDDIYEDIEEHNPNKKILIRFANMIADMINNWKVQPIVTRLFIRDRNPSIYLVSTTRPYFVIPKNIRLNSTYYFTMRTLLKIELKQIAICHSPKIVLKDFMNLYKKCIANPYFFLVNDTILALDNPDVFL